MLLHKFLFTIVIIFFATIVGAQTRALDSLKKIVNSNERDTIEVNALIELSNQYRSISVDTSRDYAIEAKQLAEKIKYPKGIGYSLKALGLVYNQQGDYVEALRYWKEGLKIFEENNIKVGAANLLNNIGVIYYTKSDERNALDYYLRSLKVSEELKDTVRISTALLNLGGVYSNKPSTYEKALNYHRQALVLSRKIKNAEIVGNACANIGEILLNQNKLDSAVIYLMEARKEYAGSVAVAYTLNVLGKVYKSKHKFSEAIVLHQHAYDTAVIYDSKIDKAQALLNIAEAYKDSTDYKSAIEFYQKAQLLFEQIGLDESYDLKSVYQGLSACYTIKKDYVKALEFQTKLLELKDKIYNIEVDKSLSTKLFAYEIDKKQSEINLKNAVIGRQNLIRNGLIGGILILVLFAGIFLKQRNRISKEKKRSDELLLNILPSEIAEELKSTGATTAKDFNEVSVLFTDFKNFSIMSEHLNAQELVNEIHYCYSAFDNIINKYGIEKIKTIGDSYMCAAGLPVEKVGHAIDLVQAGLEIRDFIEAEKQKRMAAGRPFFEVRIGINSGHVVAGIVGIKKFAYDIWGDAVNTASRMESSGEPGKVNISGSTYELVKDKFTCTYRGKVEAKNKGAIDMYFVEA